MKFMPKSKAGKIAWSIFLLILVVAAIRFVLIPLYWCSAYNPREGDIVFQSLTKTKLLPKTELVRAIEGITRSNYSHCGVVVKRNGEWYVNEALFDVHDAPLFTWVLRGRGAKFAVYRLKDEYTKDIPQFIEALEPFQGKPYDYKFKMDDDFLYCSELVYKAFKQTTGEELGELDKLGELNWQPFESTIRKYEGGPPPLNRDIITPVAVSRASQLTKVFSNGI